MSLENGDVIFKYFLFVELEDEEKFLKTIKEI